MDEPDAVRIPADQLAPETLRNVVEEAVTRDGTEFTEAETKIASVLRALERGDVELWFNPGTKSCSLHRV